MQTVPSLIGKIIAVLAAVLRAGRFGVGVLAWRAANALERPNFAVIKSLEGGVELRRYAPYFIAETEVEADNMRQGSSKGFRSVASYIFGANKPSMKMAMTAPVRTEAAAAKGEVMKMTAPVRTEPPAAGSKRTKVSFVLEKSYTKKTAPAPLDRSVRVRQVAPHLLAVRTFSGPPPSEERVELERQRILSGLSSSGLRPADGSTLVYGYHDPFITPNFLRRNEVCLRVVDNGVA